MPAPSDLPSELLSGPFTVSYAESLGISRTVLRGRRFRRPFRGVRVPAHLPDTVALRADAARLVLPAQAAFSHFTAALLRDMPVRDDGMVHVTVPVPTSRPKVHGIVCHATSDGEAVTLVEGRAVVTPERNFTELAAHLSLVDLLILGDALVRHGWTSREALIRSADTSPRRTGLRLARATARLVRPRVDSPMETRTRLLLLLAGLPCPEPGWEIHDEFGQWVATADLQYPEQKIALEYDGDLHRTLKRKWRNDVRAREELRDLGWIVIVLTADDITVRPEDLLWRVQKALLDRDHPDVPQVLNPQWQALFPPNRSYSEGW
ncbi:hypothetical protein ABN034_25770 [Actinopolymorpha sp. B11F2]|uniref:hypothetical protein n=1 Tax=Actinopolymorpha sp. B11F2 TaxID=3160862 RepID=UPI0032E3BBAA